MKRFAITLEKRYLARVVRQMKKLRPSLTEAVLKQAIRTYLPADQLGTSRPLLKSHDYEVYLGLVFVPLFKDSLASEDDTSMVPKIPNNSLFKVESFLFRK